MPDRIAIVYGVPLGAGGLGAQSANVIGAFAGAEGIEVHAFGPPPASGAAIPDGVRWHAFPGTRPAWSRLRPFRAYQGAAQYAHDRALGAWAAPALAEVRPTLCLAFTQVARESLHWCRAAGIPTILESPNGSLRAFREVYATEHARWCSGRYVGHPTARMVERVEAEYGLADRVRASSEWTRDSLVAAGVPAGKIAVLQQPLDATRFEPVPPRRFDGPLRLVFIGTLDLRKGFVYLLQAVARLNGAVSLEVVGNTVDRCTRRLLEEHGRGLPLVVAPGDPRPACRRAELAVLPTLEDGSPFAAAEAMVSGLPLITTDACGAREWLREGDSGWIVPARSVDALEAVLRLALERRETLHEMGRRARELNLRRSDPAACHAALRQWALDPHVPRAGSR